MRRLCVYLLYDRQSIIDDYIGYFLGSMRPLADTIAVVCNMPQIRKGLHNLADYADHIFYRENKGLDAGGFKDALCTFLGWEKIREYDELILANDSFYGPFEDIKKIFTEMESRSLDFWGLMKRGPGEYGTTGKDPEHILSFFYVFQSPLLHSEEFRSYWEAMPYYRDYMSAVKEYERRLTSHFAALGYTYDAYADTAPNETRNRKNQFFQCDYLSYEMLSKRKFPFLKRKQMAYNTLYAQTQENPILSLTYIEQNTDYDVNLIWKNLIRTQNHTELQRSLGLQYILEDAEVKKHSRVLLCVRTEWKNAADMVCEYLEKVRDTCEIWIISGSEGVAGSYRAQGFEALVSQKTDIEILQEIDTERYSYICLIHDTDVSSDQLPSCTGKSYFFNIWENLIRNASYVSAVAKLLEEKPYIGMLLHPVPVFSIFTGKLGFEWREHWDEVQKDAEELGLEAVLSRRIPPVHITDNFWIKAEVIQAWKERFPALGKADKMTKKNIRYLWTYLVQDAGRLTGIVESAFYASLNEPNYQYYLRTFLEWFTQRYGPHGYLHEFEEIFHVQEAVDVCREKHEKWYVYGTGEIAEKCFRWLKDADGFVVSDGQPKKQEFHGKPVLYLSELVEEDVGIVLCLSSENQEPVAELLEEKGRKNYYPIY